MAKPTYYELLKHPKWQEKRLRIMERDGFKCLECGSNDTTLNVHHGYYRKGAEPWDYEDETLHTLCEGCHKKAEILRAELYRKIGELRQEGVARLLESEILKQDSDDSLHPQEKRLFMLLVANPKHARDAIQVCEMFQFKTILAGNIRCAYRVACSSFDLPTYIAVKNALVDSGAPLTARYFATLAQEAIFNKKLLTENAAEKIGDALEAVHELVRRSSFDEWMPACTG